MKKGPQATVALLLLAVLTTAAAQETDITQDLRIKLQSSSPGFDRALFDRLANYRECNGNMFKAGGITSDINKIKNYQLPIQSVKPFKEIAVLNWGTRLESLTSGISSEFGSSQPWGNSHIIATLGDKSSDNVRIRVGYGHANISLKPVYQTISYRHCETKFLFIEKCETRHRDVQRGYSFEEMNAANKGLLDLAHQGAIKGINVAQLSSQSPFDGQVSPSLTEDSKDSLGFDVLHHPMNLLEFNYQEAINSRNLGSQETILQFVGYNIQAAQVGASVNELIHGSMSPSLNDRIAQAVQSGSNAEFQQPSSEGNWTIKLFNNRNGTWNVSSGI